MASLLGLGEHMSCNFACAMPLALSPRRDCFLGLGFPPERPATLHEAFSRYLLARFRRHFPYGRALGMVAILNSTAAFFAYCAPVKKPLDSIPGYRP